MSYVGAYGYGSLTLTETSPVQSFTEPISLEEAKAALRLPPRSPKDDDEDDLIDSYISAAREIAEIEQGCDLVRKQWDLSLDYLHSELIELRDPLVSVDLFRYRDSSGTYTTITQGTHFQADITKHPGIVTPPYNDSWPSFTGWPSGAVLIRFTSGYSLTDGFWQEAGRHLKVAMMHQVVTWFSNPQSFDAGQNDKVLTSLFRYGSRPRVR